VQAEVFVRVASATRKARDNAKAEMNVSTEAPVTDVAAALEV
jgi:hypothetical protein